MTARCHVGPLLDNCRRSRRLNCLGLVLVSLGMIAGVTDGMTLDELVQQVLANAGGLDVLDQLSLAQSTAAELTSLATSLVEQFVERCWQDGKSWTEIDAVLATSRKRRVISTAVSQCCI